MRKRHCGLSTTANLSQLYEAHESTKETTALRSKDPNAMRIKAPLMFEVVFLATRKAFPAEFRQQAKVQTNQVGGIPGNASLRSES